MQSDLEELRAAADELAKVAAGRPEAARAERLAGRLAADRFLVSVVGEFNRGKSTLVNALLGAEVLPTGVLPLTAVATEMAFGVPGSVVVFLDGTRRAIGADELADFVTEDRNAANERRVARVELRGQWPRLAGGVVLVDTPGIASLHRHNTEAARAALLDADGAVLVMSADAPVSQNERELLSILADRRSPTFFVLNKADHVSSAELGQVRRFVEQVLCETLGRKVRLFAVSARAALGPDPHTRDGYEFEALGAEVGRFIAEDLVGARLATARAELARLGEALRDTVSLEQAAVERGSIELARLVSLFETEAARQVRAFADDRTLLARDMAALGEEVAARLAGFAGAAPARHNARLAEIAATATRGRVVDDLRVAVEAAVRDSFEGFRCAETARAEQHWQALAEGFRARTQQRVNTVRQAAAHLFAVPLPQVEVPAVAEQREQFFYLFVHLGGSGEPFGRLFARLVPGRLLRRRALSHAQGELVGEFDKHAGRAHHDLEERLGGVRRSFEAAMRAELDDSIDGIVSAAARAAELARAAADQRHLHAAAADRQLRLAVRLAAWAKDAA